MRPGGAAPPSVLGWWWRFALAFWLLNTLLTFENRLIGFGVAYVPRLSFELCLAVVALMGWVAWRGCLSRRWGTVAAVGLTALVLVRYASVTAPAVLGRPVNVYWDGRHASELLRVAAQSVPLWQAAAAVLALAIGLMLLAGIGRWAIQTLGECLTS